MSIQNYFSKKVFTPISFVLLTLFSNPIQQATAGEQIALINVSPLTEVKAVDPELYEVKTLTGHFHTKFGASRNYTLYVPQRNSLLPKAPYPLVVLVHGFLMTGRQHSNNARYFAQRGFVVLTPDMTKILLGDENRMHNVKDILDQISGLVSESRNKKSHLYGLIDNKRIGIAGNSAGGAVCLEMVLEAQKENLPIKTMISLDGVPWDRTKDRMLKLKPINFLALRAEPGLCNYYSKMVTYLKLLKFPYNDVKLNGAHHCDVENPTTLGCRCVCGTSTAKYRTLFQKLTYLYFRDTLAAPNLMGSPSETFAEAVQDLQHDGTAIAKLNQSGSIQLAETQHLQ